VNTKSSRGKYNGTNNAVNNAISSNDTVIINTIIALFNAIGKAGSDKVQKTEINGLKRTSFVPAATWGGGKGSREAGTPSAVCGSALQCINHCITQGFFF